MRLHERFKETIANKTFDKEMPFVRRTTLAFLRDYYGVELTEEQNIFADFSFKGFNDPQETVEYFLRAAKVNYSDNQSGQALLHRALTTSDLPNVLMATAEHFILDAFHTAPATHRAWTVPHIVRDFQTVTFGGAAFSGFKPVKDGAEYPECKFRHASGSGQLESYGGQFAISYEAFLEGYYGLIRDNARLLGRAASMETNRLAYAALLANPRLSDGEVLFSEARGTVVKPSTLTAANLSKAAEALREQKDPAGNTLNLSPASIVVPPAMEMEARALCRSVNDAQNPFELSLTPVVEPLISAENGGSDSSWYLCSRPEDATPFAQMSLNSRGEPSINLKEDFRTDQIRYTARIDTNFVAKSAIGMIKVEAE